MFENCFWFFEEQFIIFDEGMYDFWKILKFLKKQQIIKSFENNIRDFWKTIQDFYNNS